MVNNIDTWQMLNELYAEDVTLLICEDWTDEEFHNYIVHMYDVFMFQPNWVYAEDTALVVYAIRRTRNQRWTTPFKPGARS